MGLQSQVTWGALAIKKHKARPVINRGESGSTDRGERSMIVPANNPSIEKGLFWLGTIWLWLT